MGYSALGQYHDLKPYYGDIHNHCSLSYAHGSLEAAFRNARLQLDFVSVTIHADWPDLPQDEPGLEYLVDYHREGFLKAYSNWPGYLRSVENENEEGSFLVFPSFEWHSSQYGDYCVYFRDSVDAPLFKARDLQGLRDEIGRSRSPAFIIPHHIGYKTGSRGINWNTFTEEYSPVVEIFSFHGLSESCDGPYPYLHSMGPCNQQNTAQHGWFLVKRFGVIGSTDHHNAFPGSYGYGRMGVWAHELTRDAVWDAIGRRRTYALTGDRIGLQYTLNDTLMGGIAPRAGQHSIAVAVQGACAIDTIDILHNNQVVHRHIVMPHSGISEKYKVFFEVGWGEGFDWASWDVDLQVLHGELLDVEPRLRGYSPTETPGEDDFSPSSWEQEGNRVQFQTRTRPNPASQLAMTEGFNLEIAAGRGTVLQARVNGRIFEVSLEELRQGARSFYLGGFVSPAVCFHRAVPQEEYALSFRWDRQADMQDKGWYYVRVRQKNHQYAWSSPVWISDQQDRIV